MDTEKKIYKDELEGTLFFNFKKSDIRKDIDGYCCYSVVLKNIKVIEDIPKKVFDYCILNKGNLKSDNILEIFNNVKRIKRIPMNLVLSIDFDYFPFTNRKRPTEFKHFFRSVNSGEREDLYNYDQLVKLFGKSENKGTIRVNKEILFKFLDVQTKLSVILTFMNGNINTSRINLGSILKFLRLYDFQKRLENENR